ncbi:HupE/UreJ family protein [Bradyrhizobium sp. CB3481]|uniref:HupE/UreJ family protein n=1 Tax=Bradyrhizobium sp. CB3481 TaxID=3039158 RepID=UPI0024B11E2D|nr:HupE/UreJ family protein [Bradyrhizobium sp. CB3481]WFU18665.1 HupE/UreJ family protein [Bradyrhizobium sp. CB3481]
MITCVLRWMTLALALLWSAIVLAHAVTTALIRIELVDNRLHYALSVVLPEIPNRSAELLTSAANGDRSAAERVVAYAGQTLSLELGNARCRMGRVRISGAGANDARATIEIDFTCDASHGRLEIAEDWSALLGEHYRTLGNVRTANGERQVSFEESSRKIAIEVDRVAATGWFDFIKVGVEHIITGYDHLLFLVALLATAQGIWSVVRIVTAFTLAHSVTLSIATLNILTIPGYIIEPLIAASIVWVALENLLVSEPDRRRWIWSFVFGLVHGFGFASALGELGLKGSAIVRALVGFNVGVEIGQLIFVAVFLPALAMLKRGRGASLTPRITSIAVAIAGTYWLGERIIGY